MRIRLAALVTILVFGPLATLSLWLVCHDAANRQRAFYFAKLADTARLALMAQTSTGPLDREALQRDIIRYDRAYSVSAAVAFRDGTFLASRQPAALSSPGASGLVDAVWNGRATAPPELIWPWLHRPVLAAVPVVVHGKVIAVAVTLWPTDSLRSAWWRELKWYAVVTALALSTGVLLATAFVGWVLRPVRALQAAAGRLRDGAFDTVAEAGPGPAELRRLATAFNEMAQTTRRSLDRRATFVADASHQLRNPLAALILRLDELAEAPAADRPGVHSAVRREAEQLTLVLDRLGKLATAGHTGSRRAPVALAALAAQRVVAWTPAASARGIVFDIPAGIPAFVSADEVLAGSVIDAILDNAVKYSPQGGRINVLVAAQGDSFILEVADEGPGVGDADIERLGERYWCGADRRRTEGTGLGLNIARTLLASMDGDIGFAHAAAGGLVVRIRLPRFKSETDDR